MASKKEMYLQGDCRLKVTYESGSELSKRYLESRPDDPDAKGYLEDSVKTLQNVKSVCDRVTEWERRYNEKFYP